MQTPSGIKERLLRFRFGVHVTAFGQYARGMTSCPQICDKALIACKHKVAVDHTIRTQSVLYASFGCKEEWRSVEKPENLTIQSPSGKILILSTIKKPDVPKNNLCAIAASIKEMH